MQHGTSVAGTGKDRAWLSPDNLDCLTSPKRCSTVGPNSRSKTGRRLHGGMLHSSGGTNNCGRANPLTRRRNWPSRAAYAVQKTNRPPSSPQRTGEGEQMKPKSPATIFPAPARLLPRRLQIASRKGAQRRYGPGDERALTMGGQICRPTHWPGLRHQEASPRNSNCLIDQKTRFYFLCERRSTFCFFFEGQVQ